VSERLDQLVAQHGSLKQRCATERMQLVQSAREIEGHLAGVDRGVNAVRKVMRNPLWIAGGVALVTFLGPRRLLGWATRSALFYSTAKRVMRMVR
jgi:YqjK-like protein